MKEIIDPFLVYILCYVVLCNQEYLFEKMRDPVFSSTIIEDGFTLFVKYFCLINSENMKIQMTVEDFIIMDLDFLLSCFSCCFLSMTV